MMARPRGDGAHHHQNTWFSKGHLDSNISPSILALFTLLLCAASILAVPVALSGADWPKRGGADKGMSSASPSAAKRARVDQDHYNEIGDRRVTRLRDWLAKNDACTDSIEICGQGDDRGVFAAMDIPPEGLLIRVPGKLIMTDDRAAATPLGRLVAEKGGAKLNSLQAWLIAQKFACGAGCAEDKGGAEEPEGGWDPYIEVLPETYDMPLWWDEEERARLLGGTAMLSIAKGREESLREDFERFFAPLRDENPPFPFPTNVFTYDNLLWAASTIWSRGFPSSLAPRDGKEGGAPSGQDQRDTDVVQYNDTHSIVSSSPHNASEGEGGRAQSGSCLMPLADMLNHRPNTRVTWLCTPGGVDFTTPDGVPKGSEVHNNYGPRPNRMLLLNYGFAIEGNPSDTYEMVCRVPPGLAERDRRIELAAEHGVRLDDQQRLVTDLAPCLPLCGAGPVLSLFRLASATCDELELYAGPSPSPPTPGNDMAAHTALVDELRRVKSRLSGWQRGPGGGAREKAAAAYRRGAEEIVGEALGKAEEARRAVAERCVGGRGSAGWLEEGGAEGGLVEAYLQWVVGGGGEHDARVKGCGMVIGSGGVKQGGSAVSFPATMLITPEVAMEDAEFAEAVEGIGGGLEEEEVLSLFLMQQRVQGDKGAWWPWLRCVTGCLLPSEACRPEGGGEVVEELRGAYEAFFGEGGLPKDVFTGAGDGDAGAVLYAWANALVETRGVDMRSWGGGFCVVPLVGAPLHAEASAFGWAEREGGGVRLEAMCGAGEGVAVTRTYARSMEEEVLRALHGQTIL